jgi:hypothetical protein
MMLAATALVGCSSAAPQSFNQANQADANSADFNAVDMNAIDVNASGASQSDSDVPLNQILPNKPKKQKPH